jgi:ADP-glucose pyrophosphorylase
MSGFTIISYPAQKEDVLLSLTGERSRYMLPIGGRFRIVDFTIRNSVSSGADNTIIYNNHNDGLEEYLAEYKSDESKPKKHSIETFLLDQSNLEAVNETVSANPSTNFIIYNGDNPSIIDFTGLMNKFTSSRKKSMLYKLIINGIPSMAHKILITDKRTLTGVIKKAIKEGHEAPNFFEMIINRIIHNGISTSTMTALYWPIGSVNEYYNLNREIVWNPEISNMLYRDKLIESGIKAEGYALLDEKARVKNSFISDYCYINGRVENSIIFPGVEIQDDAVVKDSIILPYVKIGEKAHIINTIIDEAALECEVPGIGKECRIGTEEKLIKNKNFPEILNSSLTLIGRDIHLRESLSIGGACYITSDGADKYFSEKTRLPDGECAI